LRQLSRGETSALLSEMETWRSWLDVPVAAQSVAEGLPAVFASGARVLPESPAANAPRPAPARRPTGGSPKQDDPIGLRLMLAGLVVMPLVVAGAAAAVAWYVGGDRQRAALSAAEVTVGLLLLAALMNGTENTQLVLLAAVCAWLVCAWVGWVPWLPARFR
jgi:hypothetical protein